MKKKYRDSKGRMYTPDPLDYLVDNIKEDKVSKCWNWTGQVFEASGYGYFKNKKVNNGVPLAASRAVWMILNGKNLGRWDFVCHKCDNRRCVNPDHLFLGSGKDNMQDCSQKRRINFGEDRPQSKLTEENVREARKLRQRGMAWRPLAAKFGVAMNCIISAVTGKTWSHVDEPIPTYVGKPGTPGRHTDEDRAFAYEPLNLTAEQVADAAEYPIKHKE